jgi:CubicO group peptidase (beta-lactamase class C family)
VSLSAPLANDPGTVWEYGVNTDWLGLIVEAISGQTLGEYVAEHIYGPLEMNDSTFRPGVAERGRLLPMRMRAADGSLGETEIDLAPDPEWDAGGHGSYGTIGDYGRFMRAWLGDGGPILAADTVALAFRDDIEDVPIPDAMEPTIPELSNVVPALGVPHGWGLGFHLTKADLPGMRSAGTGDWAGLFNCYYWIDRSAGVGGVLMTQILPFFDEQVVERLIGFEQAVYAQVGAAAPA